MKLSSKGRYAVMALTDLAKFMMIIFNQGMGPKEKVLEPETLDEMISPQFGGDHTSGYGIGFGLSQHGGFHTCFRIQSRQNES